MLAEECQLLAISVLLPVCLILILNHRRDSLIFGSEVLRIPCGAWAPRGHGREFSRFCAWNCCQFQSEEWGCFWPLWGKAKGTCVRAASSSFLQPRPSHQVSPPGSRGTVPFCSRTARGRGLVVGYCEGRIQALGQQNSVPSSCPNISYCVHREGF